MRLARTIAGAIAPLVGLVAVNVGAVLVVRWAHLGGTGILFLVKVVAVYALAVGVLSFAVGLVLMLLGLLDTGRADP